MRKLRPIFCLLAFAVLTAATAVAQRCPPNPIAVTPNPTFPGCKAPGGPAFKVLLVLDESGSIATVGATNTMKNAVRDFAEKLRDFTDAPGKLELGIIEFANSAQNALPPPNTLVDVKAGNFMTLVNNYLDSGYSPSGATNFQAALNAAAAFPKVDIIFFLTDGFPTAGNTNPTVWSAISNNLKSNGTYIFAIGVGSDVCVNHLKNLSDRDELNNPLSFQEGADWTLESFSSLGESLVELAQSLVDTEKPELTCPSPIRVNNEPGKCGASVVFNATVSDNCPNVTANCTPAPGSFFPVGTTTVNCNARDNVGNTSTCGFKITVRDLEAPKITCPANKLVSCEESLDPANTGKATATDNCGIGNILYSDERTDGPCTNEYSLTRTWTAVDVHSNASTCLQTIFVEDKKAPVITCPANITVTCDISVAKTGTATATDNCDPSVAITHRDIHISGDCDWFCVTERHWEAADDCRNTSKCVQVITRDVTPLIEHALSSGPLKWGTDQSTVTLPAGQGACVVKWLPYSGAVPTALKFDNAVAGADCKLMTNPLDEQGRIVNPLLGEAMKLKILVRLKPSLGTTKLSAIPCDMHFIVRQALAPNPDVNELLRVTDLTLGNINVNLLTPPHTQYLLDVLKCVNKGRSVCNP
jgi:uncharacterized protein YegL